MSEASPSNRFDKSFLALLSAAGGNDAAPTGRYETTLAQLIKANGTDEVLAAAEWLRLDMMMPPERDGDTTSAVASMARRIMDANFSECDAYVALPDGSFLIHLPNCDAPTRNVIASAVGKTIRQRIEKRQDGGTPSRPRPRSGENGAGGVKPASGPRMTAVGGGNDKRASAVPAADKSGTSAPVGTAAASVIKFLEQRGNDETADVPKALPKNVQTVYRPMWHVRRQMLTSYVSLPAVRQAAQAIVVGDALLPEPAQPEATSALDLPLLRRAVNDLTAALKQRRRMIVMPPVHAQTLFRPRFRDEFVEICRNSPEMARRHIVFELIVPPGDMPDFQATDIMAQIRQWCRAVIVRLPLEVTTLNIWKQLGVHAVGVDVTDRVDNERRALKSLDRFAALADNTGLQSYVQGLPSVSTTTAAVCAGFSYVAGQTLPAEADTLAGIEPFTPQMMFEALFCDTGAVAKSHA